MSIIEISKGQFDAGNILWQKKVPMDESTRFLELQQTLSTVGGQGLSSVLNNFESVQLLGVPQDSLGEATKAPMIQPEFG